MRFHSRLQIDDTRYTLIEGEMVKRTTTRIKLKISHVQLLKIFLAQGLILLSVHFVSFYYIILE